MKIETDGSNLWEEEKAVQRGKLEWYRPTSRENKVLNKQSISIPQGTR